MLKSQIDSAADKADSQLNKFKEAARELECDDDERRFKERLEKLVKQKPENPDSESKGGD